MKRKVVFCILYIIECIFLLFVLIKEMPIRIGFFLLVSIILVFIITRKLHAAIFNWEHCIKDWKCPELTFKEFYSLYIAMPENFQLNRFDVSYKYNSISFKTYFDYCKYKKFVKHYKKQKEAMKRTEIQANLIKELQQDLAAKQEENDQWVKENLKKNVHIGQTSF